LVSTGTNIFLYKYIGSTKLQDAVCQVPLARSEPGLFYLEGSKICHIFLPQFKQETTAKGVSTTSEICDWISENLEDHSSRGWGLKN